MPLPRSIIIVRLSVTIFCLSPCTEIVCSVSRELAPLDNVLFLRDDDPGGRGQRGHCERHPRNQGG